jgi:transcriptional regulator with XRE-family HTH domain
VPAVTRVYPDRVSRLVAARVRTLRGIRGWSAQRLADTLTAAAGHPTSRASIAAMENGFRRWVTVDELFAFAAVFDTTIEQLTGDDPVCPTCKDEPPAGFVCLNCGAGSKP